MNKLILCLLIVASLSLSATTIKVKYVGGVAYKKNSSGQTKITTRSIIKAGDTIITKSRSFVALLLSDKSVHKITANTIYEVKTLAEDKTSRTQIFNIKKGKIFNYVSKSFKKSNIKFITPTAIVGVRGTAFAIETSDTGTSVFLTSGVVDVGAYRNGQASQVSVMQAGNFAKINKKVEVKKMTEADYESATKGVPVKLGAVQLVPKDAENQEVATTTLKNDIRTAVSKESQRVNEINQAQANSKQWDAEFKKQVGPYSVRQYFRKEDAKTIVLDTFTSSKGKEYLLGLNLTFKGRIPDLSDQANGTVRDIDKSAMTIKGTVDGKTDTLIYQKDNVKSSQNVSLNDKQGTINNKETKHYTVSAKNSAGTPLAQAIPKQIVFDVNGAEYKFNFNIGFTDGSVNTSGTLNNNQYKLTDIGKEGVLDKVLEGDLDTRINVSVETKGKEALNGDAFKDKFDLILLNDFFVPLLQN